MKGNEITDSTQIVACTDTFRTWDFVYKNQDAIDVLDEAVSQNQKSIQTWLSHAEKYPEGKEAYLKYAEQEKSRNYKIMTFGEYCMEERKHYLSYPITEVTEDKFWEMLEVLPPKNWVTINRCEEFCMIEHLTDPYTSQYARKDNKYYHKTVDAYDKTTWIHNLV